MSDSDYVQVNLTVQNNGVARQGYGKGLIVSHTADWVERTRTYSSLLGVLEDFDADEPEAIAAAAIFSQEPHPPSIGIGRATGAIIQRYDSEVVDVVEGAKYRLRVNGTGFDETLIEVTAGVGDDEDDIVGDLVTALNAVVDKNYTASAVVDASGPDMLRIVGNAAGDWFSVEVLDRALLSIAQTHADFDVDEDLTAMLDEDPSWYWVVTLYNSVAYVKTVATWVEGNGRAYTPELCDTASITTAYDDETSLDALATLLAEGYKRTEPMFHGKPVQFAGAAKVGMLAPRNPGSWTSALKTLTGVTPTSFTATERTNLVARRGNGYETAMGRQVTFDGMVGNTQFGFLDVIVGLDALVDDLRAGVFGVKLANGKVPATEEGIALIEAAALGSLKRYSTDERQVLKRDASLKVIPPTLDDFDSQTRTLSNLRVQGSLANAVQHTVIDLTVTN